MFISNKFIQLTPLEFIVFLPVIYKTVRNTNCNKSFILYKIYIHRRFADIIFAHQTKWTISVNAVSNINNFFQ